MPFPIFEQYTATVTKKIKFHWSRYESYDTVEQRDKVGMSPAKYTQYLQTQALVSPMKWFSHSMYATKPPKQDQSHPQYCWPGDGSCFYPGVTFVLCYLERIMLFSSSRALVNLTRTCPRHAQIYN